MPDPKKYYEVKHPDDLDDDGGKRGIDAAKVAETFGPWGWHKLFANLEMLVEAQAYHFRQMPTGNERERYLKLLFETRDRLEELQRKFQPFLKH